MMQAIFSRIVWAIVAIFIDKNDFLFHFFRLILIIVIHIVSQVVRSSARLCVESL